MATTQNTLVVIGDTTIAANIKPAILEELTECSRLTKKPLSRLLNEAIYEFMTLRGSDYMENAGYLAPYRPGYDYVDADWGTPIKSAPLKSARKRTHKV